MGIHPGSLYIQVLATKLSLSYISMPSNPLQSATLLSGQNFQIHGDLTQTLSINQHSSERGNLS